MICFCLIVNGILKINALIIELFNINDLSMKLYNCFAVACIIVFGHLLLMYFE